MSRSSSQATRSTGHNWKTFIRGGFLSHPASIAEVFAPFCLVSVALYQTCTPARIPLFGSILHEASFCMGQVLTLLDSVAGFHDLCTLSASSLIE